MAAGGFAYPRRPGPEALRTVQTRGDIPTLVLHDVSRNSRSAALARLLLSQTPPVVAALMQGSRASAAPSAPDLLAGWRGNDAPSASRRPSLRPIPQRPAASPQRSAPCGCPGESEGRGRGWRL